jgi:hypothetical protein
MVSEINLSGVFHLIRMTKRGQDQLSDSKLLNCALRRVLCESLQACGTMDSMFHRWVRPRSRMSYTTRVWSYITALRYERRFGEEPRVLRSLCDDKATTYPELAVEIWTERRCKLTLPNGVVILDVPSVSTNLHCLIAPVLLSLQHTSGGNKYGAVCVGWQQTLQKTLARVGKGSCRSRGRAVLLGRSARSWFPKCVCGLQTDLICGDCDCSIR